MVPTIPPLVQTGITEVNEGGENVTLTEEEFRFIVTIVVLILII